MLAIEVAVSFLTHPEPCKAAEEWEAEVRTGKYAVARNCWAI
jgi:hypothetical protein